MVGKEYDALRREIQDWGTRRFQLALVATPVATAILAVVARDQDGWSWALASGIVLLALAPFAWLTWLFGRFMARLGAYIEEFGGSRYKYEKRAQMFRKGRCCCGLPRLTFSRGLSVLYLSLGLVFGGASGVLSSSSWGSHPSEMAVLIVGSVCLFLPLMLLFWDGSFGRAKALKKWEEVKQTAS